MATSKTSKFQPIQISPYFHEKTFALKWPEQSDNALRPIPVNLYIDPKGFYLVCVAKATKEIQCFDLSLIHDTRTGAQVTLPKGAKECSELHIRTSDESIQSKWLTIAYGNSFVPTRELRLIHFCFMSQKEARAWTENLFTYGHSLYLRNLSNLQLLEKLHARITEGVVKMDRDEPRIVVKELIRFLCKNNVDPRRESKILDALKRATLPSERDSKILPKEFTFEKFFVFYLALMRRDETKALFDETRQRSNENIRSVQFQSFLQKQGDHNDPMGLNILGEKANDLMKKYRDSSKSDADNSMSYNAFLRYLLSCDNYVLDPKSFELFMDMDRPLPEYFISSSHNTYLTASQYLGKSSIEMYRQVLLTGCRCIELDVMDSDRKADEPEIKHRNTPIRPIWFIDTIVAIRDSAFKVTSYPLVLSLENHCSPAAQKRMARYLVDVFGDSLLVHPLKTHPCEEDQPLPSPNQLRNKILIKNKKCCPKTCPKMGRNLNSTGNSNSNSNGTLNSPTLSANVPRQTSAVCATSSDESSVAFSTLLKNIGVETKPSSSSSDDNSGNSVFEWHTPPVPPYCPRDPNDDDDDFSDNESIAPESVAGEASTFHVNSVPEAQATKDMSDLVVYTVPVSWVPFEIFASRRRCYEMFSANEDRANQFRKQYPKEFLSYNQRQISRIYPRGTRLDSSNFDPYPFWSVGCQMVALNYQTLDIPMQLNLALFAFNGGCGYLQKPSILCQPRTCYDPLTRTKIENVVVYDIRMKILSGQYFCQDREPTYVDVKMFGTYADSIKRSEHKIRAKKWNGFQAIYGDDHEFSLEFSSVILSELASIRIEVQQEDRTMVGQAVLPLSYLRTGYRHVVLRNPMNMCVPFASLFVYIDQRVHVNDENQHLAVLLRNPMSSNGSNSTDSPESGVELTSYLIRMHSSSSSDSTHSSQDRSSVFSGAENATDELTGMSHSLCVRVHLSSNSDGHVPLSPTEKSRGVEDYMSEYHKHLISASQFQRPHEVCKFISLNQFEKRAAMDQQRQTIHNEVNKFIAEQEKVLKAKEEKYQKRLSGPYRPPSLSQRSYSASSEMSATDSHLAEKKDSKSLKAHEDAEKKLMHAYSESFHRQEDFESTRWMKYYDDLEELIVNEYNEQRKTLDRFLQQEMKRVQEVAHKMEKEEKTSIKKEKEKTEIKSMKQTITAKHQDIIISTCKTIAAEYEDVVEQLNTYRATTLEQLENKRQMEVERCFEKYILKYSEIERRFLPLTDENNDDEIANEETMKAFSSPARPPMTASASLSAALVWRKTDFFDGYPRARRQTMQP